MDIPIEYSCQIEYNTNRFELGRRSECLMIVMTSNLAIATRNKTNFILPGAIDLTCKSESKLRLESFA